jgi:hypothetical protein
MLAAARSRNFGHPSPFQDETSLSCALRPIAEINGTIGSRYYATIGGFSGGNASLRPGSSATSRATAALSPAQPSAYHWGHAAEELGVCRCGEMPCPQLLVAGLTQGMVSVSALRVAGPWRTAERSSG